MNTTVIPISASKLRVLL